MARRDAAQAEMQREVDLGMHSIPGQTLDAVGEREAGAYVERVRGRWRDEDARFAHAIADSDAALRAEACPKA